MVGLNHSQSMLASREWTPLSENILSEARQTVRGLTFVEEHHDLGKGLHEVDVIVAVLLDL